MDPVMFLIMVAAIRDIVYIRRHNYYIYLIE